MDLSASRRKVDTFKADAPGARGMPFRGFVAVEVGPRPAVVRLLDVLAASGADLKLVEPENLHVTLKFLGDVPDDALPAVEAAVRAAARPERPFTARLHRVGQFPPRGAARVWWVGMSGAEALVRIATRLESSLAPLGFPPEARPFTPHLTVARARSAAGADKARAATERVHVDDHVDVRRVVLYRSDLGRDGPTYTPVVVAPLEG